MYITNLNFGDTKPTEYDWGNSKKHVPLNVRETSVIDEDGNKKIQYIGDLVEKVDMPITVDNIVKAAAIGKFGEDITYYVAANIYKTNDPKIQEYTEFVKVISAQAMEAGYK